jgi:hypothetical protein
MGKQKIDGRIVTFLFLLLFSSSCKKMGEEKYGVKIKIVYPHLNVGVDGVKYEILEVKNKFSWAGDYFQKFENRVVKSGTLENSTDFQIIEFMGKKNEGKYDYYINFEYTNLKENDQVYSTKVGLGGGMLAHAYCTEDNTYELYVLSQVKNLTINYRNANCFDNNDSFKFRDAILERVKFIERKNEVDFNLLAWINNPNFQGCTNYNSDNPESYAGTWIIQWEAIRNGITTTDIDTFLIKEDNQIIELVW